MIYRTPAAAIFYRGCGRFFIRRFIRLIKEVKISSVQSAVFLVE